MINLIELREPVDKHGETTKEGGPFHWVGSWPVSTVSGSLARRTQRRSSCFFRPVDQLLLCRFNCARRPIKGNFSAAVEDEGGEAGGGK